MRIIATLLIAMAAAACASSWDKSETIVAEIGRVPVEQAMGLSRVEIETRLGLKPAEKPMVVSAWIEDGVLVERVGMFDLAQQQRCPSGQFPALGFTRVGKTWVMPSLIFRDDKLSGFGNESRLGDDPTQPAFLTATCTTHHRAGKDTARDIAMIAVSAPILLPVGAALAGVNAVASIGSPDINAGLAPLSLGVPPPGGLEAYLTKLPPGARLKNRDNGVVRIEFCRRKCAQQWVDQAATVTFVDGLVMRLDGSKCMLTPVRAFQCAE